MERGGGERGDEMEKKGGEMERGDETERKEEGREEVKWRERRR